MGKTILIFILMASLASAQQIKPFQPTAKPAASTPPRANTSSPTTASSRNKTDKDGKIPFSAANPEDITNENYPDLIESFDYPNADITDVIKAISELTGKNFIIDPNVTRGKISIVAPSQITVAEAYKAFLTALATNGLTVIPAGKFLKITQARKAIKDSIETYSGSYAPDTDMMITRIVHVKYISAEELDKRIRILISNDGTMAAYPPTNSLIISDYGSNIERMVKIIERLDVPGFEEKMEVVPVKFAKAKDIADLVDQILDKEGKRKGGRGANTFTSTVPRFGERPADTTTEAFRVISDDRTNSLIVVGNQSGIAKVTKLIQRLDYKLRPEDAGGVHVYYVKYGDAEAITNTLNGIAQKAKQTTTAPSPNPMMPFNPAPPTEALFGGDVKVQADKATNSLIITASKQDYIVIYNLLRKIDIPRDQIYVEAIIMETNASKVNNYSASFVKFASDNGIARTGFISGDPGTVLNPLAAGGILGFGGGGNITLTNPTAGGTPLVIPSLLGLITFLKNTTDGNVLSNPQIMALNNEKAIIEVGTEVPVSASATTTAGGVQTTNIERKNATIKLTIEPFISPNSDRVRMKVDQKIVDVNKTASFGSADALTKNAIALDTRTIETSILVRDGDTAVLGGLMKNAESIIETKIPVLGDIPLIGWLFKSRNTDVRKTNLLVFLTPKIMRAGTSHNDLVEEKLNRRAQMIRDDLGGRDPHGREIDRLFRSKRARKNVPKDEIIDETLSGEESSKNETERVNIQ